LPIVAIGRKESWNIQQTTKVALWSAAAHALSTVLIGVVLAFVGKEAHEEMEKNFHFIAPGLMVVLGLIFIYRHYRHKHFHLHGHVDTHQSSRKVIAALVLIMFLSPCFEVEAYFLLAGSYGWSLVAALATIYTITTVTGIVLWVRLAYKGAMKLNWHALEHNSGIVTGGLLVLTGIVSFFYH
jgi:hypothetical protein